MKLIPLFNNGRSKHRLFTKVSNKDFKWLSKWPWHTHQGYVVRNEFNNKTGVRTTIRMHRVILGLKIGDKRKGEHKDRDGLNNQRKNIRIASDSENMANRRRWGKTSDYRGVYKRKKKKPWNNDRWRATITKNGKSIIIGSFKTPESAALAYNKKAIELHGKFASLNVVR